MTALISSGLAILFQFALFLIVGVMLWAYYRVPSSVFGRPDRIYPTFIVTRMPHGISGLLVAAILAAAMSNLSAALNSLSSSAIMDFYAQIPSTKPTRRRKMLFSRIATFLWAIVLFASPSSPCTRRDAWLKSDCRSLPSPTALFSAYFFWECLPNAPINPVQS